MSARHLCKLTQLTFAPGYRRCPASRRSGAGRATPSGRARDPGSPAPSPFIPFRPWGSPSASTGLRASREGWAREWQCPRTEQGMEPVGEPDRLGHPEHPPPVDRSQGLGKRKGGEELWSDASGGAGARSLGCQEHFAPQGKRESSLR